MAEQPPAVASAYAMGSTVNQIHQEQYFAMQRTLKRAAPTPTASAMNTPQGETPSGGTATVVVEEPHLVQPVILDDHTAFQATAAAAGVNINDPQQLQTYGQQAVTTVQDVFKVVRNYHTAVVRPEMRGMVVQLEHAIRKVNDTVFNCQRELQFMDGHGQSCYPKARVRPHAGDNRLAERAGAGKAQLYVRLDAAKHARDCDAP